MKQRDLIKRLREAGYEWLRDDGGHTIYGKAGCRNIPIPRHREINERLAQSILKLIEPRE